MRVSITIILQFKTGIGACVKAHFMTQRDMVHRVAAARTALEEAGPIQCITKGTVAVFRMDMWVVSQIQQIEP